jgi:hypothetical protein
MLLAANAGALAPGPLSSATPALLYGSWGGRRPNMVGYVTVTGAKEGATAAGCRACCLSSLAVELQQLDARSTAPGSRSASSRAEDEQQEIEARLTLDQLQSERREVQASIDKLRHESAARRRGFVELERSLREDNQKTTIRTGALRAELHQSRGNESLVSAPCAGTVLRLWVQAFEPLRQLKDSRSDAPPAAGGRGSRP